MTDDSFTDTAEFPAFKKQRPDSVAARTVVDLGALSHPGNIRPVNEDSFFIGRARRSLETLLTNLPAGEFTDRHSETAYCMLVADGVGGAAAGEVASRTAISALLDLAIQTPDWILQLDEARARQVRMRMKERFDRLRDALDESVLLNPDLAGMATTMTVSLSLGADLFIGHVGDSRAYLFTEGQIVPLTRDQTMAQLLADAGVITRAEADEHYARHVLTGAITADGQRPEVELHQFRLLDGDQLLLCSDGLTDMVNEADIVAVLAQQNPAMESCQLLIDAALQAGGKDNVTVALSRYKIPPDLNKGFRASGSN